MRKNVRVPNLIQTELRLVVIMGYVISAGILNEHFEQIWIKGTVLNVVTVLFWTMEYVHALQDYIEETTNEFTLKNPVITKNRVAQQLVKVILPPNLLQ
jgi:hypothetical protein